MLYPNRLVFVITIWVYIVISKKKFYNEEKSTSMVTMVIGTNVFLAKTEPNKSTTTKKYLLFKGQTLTPGRFYIEFEVAFTNSVKICNLWFVTWIISSVFLATLLLILLILDYSPLLQLLCKLWFNKNNFQTKQS